MDEPPLTDEKIMPNQKEDLPRQEHPKLLSLEEIAHPPAADEVVITGISGSFPESNGMNEFRDNLFNKVDLINDKERRWGPEHPEVPKYSGKVIEINKFDAAFFGVHAKQAEAMDPLLRIALERAYEAIVDAGVNPSSLRGTKCGVIGGCSYSESEKTVFYDRPDMEGYGITGNTRAFLANRISYWLGVQGVSCVIDTACSSSLTVIDRAYRNIRLGLIDSALVFGANLCLHPHVSLQFQRLGVLSDDGRCKSFDEAANGYGRSECIAVCFLQKAKDARRIYAQIVHAKSNCDGFKEHGITYPGRKMQEQLLKECYEEANILPTSVAYFEAHATGTKAGDPVEVGALDEIFCKDRKEPLLIGCVKSNMGHAEPSAGLSSVAKVILAMETGLIPPNLNFNNPRKEIGAIASGRVKVVSEPTTLPEGVVGINSFGFGGANAHLILKKNEKAKIQNGTPLDNIPRLLTVSGRTKEAVEVLLNNVASKPLDIEFIHLLNLLFADDIHGHNYRGFGVYTNSGETVRGIQIKTSPLSKIHFVFPGLVAPNASVVKNLIKFPPFFASIIASRSVLLPKGLDILDILTGDNISLNDDITNALVSVAAVQIALIDTLAAAGIYPEFTLGHSIGELAAAYCARDIIAEQVLLASYSVGKVLQESNLPRTATLLVGANASELSRSMPKDVYIAAINGEHCTTVTGPVTSLTLLQSSLKANGISAKEINTFGVGLHTKYIASAEKKLLHVLRQVIPDKKARSEKWISSSAGGKQFNDENRTDLCCAEFFHRAILKPTNLLEAAALMPKGGITLEIGPDAPPDSILAKILTNVYSLTQKSSIDASSQFLSTLGRLYLGGHSIVVPTLYPSISLPVSRGTPMIAPLVRWDHERSWFTPNYSNVSRYSGRGDKFVLNLKNEDCAFVEGHVIDCRTLYPATGYLRLVWLYALSWKRNASPDDAIVFKNVKFIRATSLLPDSKAELFINMQPSSGQFEITEGRGTVVTGVVKIAKSDDFKDEKAHPEVLTHGDLVDEDKITLSQREIYKEFRLRGYNYTGLFRGLETAKFSGRSGTITWNGNWVTFMDACLQIQLLTYKSRDLCVPVGIEKIIIDPKAHFEALDRAQGGRAVLPINNYRNVNIIKAGGVEFWNAKAQTIARRKPLSEPVLEKYSFQPHSDHPGLSDLNINDTLRLAIHLALENSPGVKIKILELADQLPHKDALLAPAVASILSDLPLIQAEVKILDPYFNLAPKEVSSGLTVEHKDITGESGCFAVVGSNLINRPEILEKCLVVIKDDGYIITLENDDNVLKRKDLTVLFSRRVDDGRLILLKKKSFTETQQKVINIKSGGDFSWISEVKCALASTDISKVILFAEKDDCNGILGLVNCLIKEPAGEKIRSFFIKDFDSPPFNVGLPLYAQQLDKDLVINVLQKGVWGSYRHQVLPKLEKVNAHHVYVDQSVRGDLSSLGLIEGPLNSMANRGVLDKNDYIKVCYATINFKDVMVATAKITLPAAQEELSDLGIELCGVTGSGERVVGFVRGGALNNIYPVSNFLMKWKIPDHWSMEEAITFPVVYLTANQAIVEAGKPKRGESILIHSAAGGIGIAAINIALGLGLEIFVTVGTQEKVAFIRSNYAQIPPSHIGNSRDISFEDMIKRETGNRGVDIVLNSLADEKLEASLRCLAEGGRFLEIGKYDLLNDVPLALDPFIKNISYHSVMIDVVADLSPRFVVPFIENGQKLLNMPFVKPLPRTVFNFNEAEKAFRYMASGKHFGKVVLKIQDENDESTVTHSATPRFFCERDGSYIVIGGLGGFGLELANWLTIRGAKNLVLSSRNGVRTGYQAGRISLWRKLGVKVLVSTEDISSETGVEKLLKDASALGPVDGIFNLAVLLRDSIFENQTEESFKVSFSGKAKATDLLDRLSRIICPDLQQFVVFSSVSCGRGNAGQANYGMSNSVMERICEKRVAEGLPGLAIQWGAIGEVGLVAEMAESNQELVIGGTLQQTIASCLQCLEIFMKQKEPVVASMVVAEKRSNIGIDASVVETVAAVLAIRDLKMISFDTTLSELGMDSMTGVEIKQCLEREFDVFLTAQDLRSTTFAKLAEIDNARCGEVSQAAVEVEERIPFFKFLMQSLPREEDAVKRVVRLRGPSEKKPAVFLIAGIDALTSHFELLSERLVAPSICLNYPYQSSTNSSVKATAQFMLATVEEYLGDDKTFTLAAHSGGSLAAIELAALLEGKGRRGEIILLDGSPAFLSRTINAYNVGTTDKDIENSVLCISYEKVIKRDPFIKGAIEKLSTWEEKYSFYREKIGTIADHRDEHLEILMKDLVHRFKSMVFYKRSADDKIASKITLIRPTFATVMAIENDYGLSEITKENVAVHVVDGDHLSMLSNHKTADIVNQILSSKNKK